MEPLFPPWASSVLWASLAFVGISIVAVPACLVWFMRSPYATGRASTVAQPIPFDHRHHVRDDGIDCLYCHATATKDRYAGIPPSATCMGCHAQVWSQTDVVRAMRASHESGDGMRWTRIHALPDFVFFDHSIHTRKGVPCVACHGHVDEMASIVQEAPLTMRWCLECHRDPERNLVPPSEVTTARAPKSAAERHALALASDVHPPTHCSACHR